MRRRCALEAALWGFFGEQLHDLRLEVSDLVHFPLAVHEVLPFEVPHRRLSVCDLVQVAPQRTGFLALDVPEAEKVAVLAVLEPFPSLYRANKTNKQQQQQQQQQQQIVSRPVPDPRNPSLPPSLSRSLPLSLSLAHVHKNTQKIERRSRQNEQTARAKAKQSKATQRRESLEDGTPRTANSRMSALSGNSWPPYSREGNSMHSRPFDEYFSPKDLIWAYSPLVRPHLLATLVMYSTFPANWPIFTSVPSFSVSGMSRKAMSTSS